MKLAIGYQQGEAKADLRLAVVSLIQSTIKQEEKISPVTHIYAHFCCCHYDYIMAMFLSFQTSLGNDNLFCMM